MKNNGMSNGNMKNRTTTRKLNVYASGCLVIALASSRLPALQLQTFCGTAKRANNTSFDHEAAVCCCVRDSFL